MISQTADYSLRAVLILAGSQGQPLTANELAKRAHLPPGYFAKVLQTLARAGIVASQRGLGGGFYLAKPIEQLSMWDVIKVIDPSRRIHTCPLNLPEHRKRLCPLHQRIDAAAASVEEILGHTTFAQLLREQPAGPGVDPVSCATSESP